MKDIIKKFDITASRLGLDGEQIDELRAFLGFRTSSVHLPYMWITYNQVLCN